MKLKYINNPTLINTPTNIKGMVQEIVANAEVGRWVEIRSSKAKTTADYNRIYASYVACKARYSGLEWSIHKAKRSFTLIARRTV